MAFTRLHTQVERIRASVKAKKREADKRALREINSRLVNTGKDTGVQTGKMQSGTTRTADNQAKTAHDLPDQPTTKKSLRKALAAMVMHGIASARAVIFYADAKPQVQPDPSPPEILASTEPVVARPVYVTADQAVRQSIYHDDSSSNLRGLIESYNRGAGNTGFRTRGKS